MPRELMWAQVLTGPSRFGLVEVPRPRAEDLGPGDVLLEVLAGGVCGSDLPIFRGQLASHGDVGGRTAAYRAGHPLHEVVGRVVSSRHADVEVGSTVVGWATRWDSIAEYCVTDGDGLNTYDPGLKPEIAILLQPLACVLYAAGRLSDVEAANVAVIGLGPIGLLFTHVLKAMGARRVVGVDRVDRSDLAAAFGIDEVVCSSSDRWSAGLAATELSDIVIEAVGHQTATLRHAILAAAPHGQIFYFGIADEVTYPFDLLPFLRKGLTFRAGVAYDRRRMLALADAYVGEHPELADAYVTNVFPMTAAQDAFELACVPAPGRVKVVLAAT